MYASELIDKLKQLINQYGDYPCEDSYGDQIGDPEFNDDGDSSVFVIADKA